MMNRRWRHYTKFPPILFTEASYTGSRLQQVKRCNRNKLLKVGKSHVTECRDRAVADPREAPPTDQIFLILCSFSRLSLEGWRPSYWKSWIRPCRDIYKYGKYMNDPVADRGFSRWGCANYQIRIILQIFCRLHKNERIWTGGGRVPGTPLRSTNGICDCPCVCHDTTYCRGGGGFPQGNEQLICFLFVIF